MEIILEDHSDSCWGQNDIHNCNYCLFGLARYPGDPDLTGEKVYTIQAVPNHSIKT